MPFDIIRDLIKDGGQIWAHCGPPCWHSRNLDLHALGERLGYDFEVSHYSLTPKLRCSKCGSKQVGIRHIPAAGHRAPGIVDGKLIW